MIHNEIRNEIARKTVSFVSFKQGVPDITFLFIKRSITSSILFCFIFQTEVFFRGIC